MSTFGTKQTCTNSGSFSAYGRKADNLKFRSGTERLKRHAIKSVSPHRGETLLVRTSIHSKAIEHAGAAGGLEIVLRAAASGPARRMRRIPRLGRRAVVEAGAVVMADHRGTRPALGPVAAGAVVADGEGRAIRLRAGEDVVHVR
jgi:hypothetical protein